MSEKLYTEDQLFDEAMSFFNGDKLATTIWIKKYALKHKENNEYFLEKHPNETIERITKEISRIEQKYPNPLSYKEVYNTLKDFKHFIFAGSILYGLGNENYISSLGNCFFINNNVDSYGGILNLDETLVQMMKRRGGVGITLEHLRPTSASVNNSAQTSTGIIPFAERFSNSTREVAQDGRRGALMESLLVKHPNIEEFITAKDDLGKITGANISIKVTDDFMKAVADDEDYILRWPVNKKINLNDISAPYNKIIKLEDETYIKKVRARKIWDKITNQVHKSAEPGILFWDKILKESPSDMYSDYGFESQGVNPCITGDALIHTNKGKLTIPDIMKEDDIKVVTYNVNTNTLEEKEVEHAMKTKENANIIEIELENNDKLKLTPDHKVFTENRGWVEAAQLSGKDVIIGIDD